MSDTKQNIIKTISKTPLPAMFKPFYGGLGSILFMHKVVASKDPNKIRIPLNDANEVSISYLEELILYFKKKGYDIISLEDLPKRLNHASKDAKKFVIFTFDDGYKDNLTLAYPIFKKHQVPMTVYITNCFPNHSAKLWWYLLEDLVMEQEEISVEIANRVRSITLRRLPADRLNLWGSSPPERTGKSSVGRQVRVKRERPAFRTKLLSLPVQSNSTCEPSGNLRTISKRVCARAVVDPWISTSAGTVSTISRSMSVAFKLKLLSGASNFTLDRIGIVLRRSTTL